MRIDTYTKVVLTVIAVCLVWMAIGGPPVIAPIQAQGNGITRVRIVGYDQNLGAQHVVIDGWSGNGGSANSLPIPVRVVPQP